MRILLVTYGWPQRQSGGLVQYFFELCNELKKHHEVYVFYAGDYDFRLSCYLNVQNKDGLHLASLVNSPNDCCGYMFPMAECRQPLIENLFLKFLELAKPDMVHFHELGGLCGSLVGLTKERGCKTIVTAHNYWFICPRIDLLRPPDNYICPGPQEGISCASCITRSNFILRKGMRLKETVKSVIKKNVKLKRKIQGNILRFTRLLSRFNNIYKTEKPLGIFQISKNVDPLKVSEYQFREDYLKKILLEKIDLFIAISNCVKQVFLQHGVPEDKIGVLSHSLKHIEKLVAHFDNLCVQLHKPINFGFLGSVHPRKGVHIAIEAFNRLPKGSARLLIFGAQSGARYLHYLMGIASKNVEFRGAYSDLIPLFKEIDVAVIPSICYDNYPTTVLESLATRKPVIGSRIGGITDLIQDEVNGLLFTPGDIDDLASKMRRIIENPDLIESFRLNIKRHKTFKEHISELDKIYEELYRTK